MGEVYRARDAKLNRDVALKTLPEAFALDPERLARFNREAQVLASYDIPPDGRRFPMITPGGTSGQAATDIIVVQNWFEEFKRLVPTSR